MNIEDVLEEKLKGETRFTSAKADLDILAPEHFVSMVRGKTDVKNTGITRECRVEIFTRTAAKVLSLSGVFGCRGAGWLDSCEVVLLNTGNRTLVWKRKGRQGDIFIDGRKAGRIEFGWSFTARIHRFCVGMVSRTAIL
jgi:hypothetical protein